MLNGIKGIYYREIRVMRTRIRRSIVASMVSPALFLVAFGYGLGRGQAYGGLAYLDFLFAGLLAMSTLNACYGLGTDINIARFYFKTFDEYLIAPVPRWQVVAGEVLFGMTKGMINVGLFFAYALIADLNIHVTPLFVLALLMHMAIFSLLGFIVALAVRNHGDQSSISTFLITPMTFLSGVFFPVEQAPQVLQWIVTLFPVSHSVSLMRASLTGGEAALWHLAALAVFLVLFAAAALRLARRTQG
ncbi:ABC transporter permease [Desulfovibrio sp. OttesenSCG-928-C06]|nr:ABC transporter permease [Desulfovibrio sp. OttesenSCG-928-C06]